MRFLRFNAALAVNIVLHTRLSQAQEPPPAKCDAATGFDWAFNSKHQSPCDVATALGGVCRNGAFEVQALNATTEYLGPTLAAANPCRCNTVFYSLLSACAACQSRPYLKWSLYSTNCSTSQKNAPVVVPVGTAVPSWAYFDVKSSDNFNPVIAKELANGPESTGTPQPTSSNTQSQSTLTLPTDTSASQLSTSDNSHDNTGAIVGGVIGGVAGVSIIAALGFWFFRLRNLESHRPEILDSPFDVNTRNLPGPPTPVRSTNDHQPSTYISPYMVMSTSASRIYNPSDPSTFPNAQGMHSLAKTSSGQSQSPRASTSQHHRNQSAGSSIPSGNASIYSAPSHYRKYSGGHTIKPEI